jgi:serine phosphatase RsbU (regulator of sigma subunit)
LNLSVHSKPSTESAISSRHRLAAGAKRLGVRVLLFMALGASSVVPVGLLGFDQAKRWAASELAQTDRQALGAAAAAADQLSLAMLADVRAAETFAAQLGNGGRLDRASMAAALTAHVQNHPEFLGAYVADAEGRSLLHMNQETILPGGHDYSDRDYYREIIQTGRAAVSSVHLGRVTGVLTVLIGAPIYDGQHTLIGITCSSVDLGSIADKAKNTVRSMREGRVLVIDGEGRRIADSNATALLGPEDMSTWPVFARPATLEPELRLGADDLGRDVRGFAVALEPPVATWHVLALTPEAEIDAQASRVKHQTTLLAFGVGLGSLTAAAALAAWLARPVRALAAAALAVTRGDFDTLPNVPRDAPREMAQLTLAVRTMIERLRSHARELESVVAARTAELSRTNADMLAALDTIRRHEQSRDDDLAKARLFQAKLLPTLPRRPDLSIAAHYAPLDQVGGDIYDVLELESECVRIFLADATGHGVQASMRTLVLKIAYDRLKGLFASPNELLAALNAHLVSEFPDGDLHCSACCVDIRPDAHGANVSYSNAGAAPLYVLSPQKVAIERYAEGPLLGVDQVRWPEPSRFRLEPGQLLILASDGLVEQPNALRQRFDVQLGTLHLGSTKHAAAALEQLMGEFDRFLDGERMRDDVTVVVVGPPAPSARAEAAASQRAPRA